MHSSAVQAAAAPAAYVLGGKKLIMSMRKTGVANFAIMSKSDDIFPQKILHVYNDNNNNNNNNNDTNNHDNNTNLDNGLITFNRPFVSRWDLPT